MKPQGRVYAVSNSYTEQAAAYEVYNTSSYHEQTYTGRSAQPSTAKTIALGTKICTTGVWSFFWL